MSMFIKSALAMLITVGFAGGAVYYGTDGALDVTQSAGAEVDLRTPLKIEAPKPSADSTSTDVSNPEKAEPEKTDAAVKTKTSVETIEVTEPEKQSENVPGSQPVPEPESTFEDSEVEPLPEKLTPVSKPNLAHIMPMLMGQVEKISTVEIKDQAYLDIVNFSVSQRQFTFADSAMQKIDQTELRDTARSQIAIGLALDGRADDAFEVIDAVEIDALRDVMRLQVIEALIVPGKLPVGLVRQ